MYLGIERQSRRNLLRNVLHNFLNTPPQQVTEDAKRLYAEMATEARLILREITASEVAQQSGATTATEQEHQDAR